MQPELPAAGPADAVAAAVGADLLRNVAGFSATVPEFAADRCRKNLAASGRLATYGSPAPLSIEAAAEATADGYAFAQRLCGVLHPTVVGGSLAVS